MELISDGKPLYLTSEKGKTFRLIEDWKFKHDNLTPILVVPEGYTSDLASIPSWIFWWQWGKWNVAAIAHDYIYEHGYILLEEYENGFRISSDILKRTKKEADFLFYEICCFLGVPPITGDLLPTLMQAYNAGFPRLTTRFSWLFLVSKFFTHYLDMKSHPRRSDCPGSFHSPQSRGTAFKMYPSYGKHFTQTPNLQSRLFLVCNSLCLIFKVLASFSFLFIRSSVTSDPLIRSNVL